ncbi:hypothetical protein ABN224_16800 [Providencia rettgeri]
MKYKLINIISFFWLIFVFLFSYKANSINNLSHSIPITLIKEKKTCNLDIIPVYNMGILPVGRKKHSPFSVDINCKEQTNVGLKVEIIKGIVSNNKVILIRSNKGSGNSLFWLENSDGNILGLLGNEFCQDDIIKKKCYITPVTNIKRGASRGEYSVKVRFTIIYN